MKRVIVVALALAALSATLAGSQLASAAPRAVYQWVVDDQFGTEQACKGANSPTLVAAVAAAGPGDSIKVCPGNYAGTAIDKALTIVGPNHNPLKCNFPSWTANSPQSYSVVTGGLVILADGVTIKNLTIEDGAAGVLVGPTISNLVLGGGNIIQSNTVGVHLSGSNHEIVDNCIRFNNDAGTGSGNGVLVDQGVSNVLLKGNKYADHNLNAINLLGPSGGGTGTITGVTIRDDESFDDYHFLQTQDTTTTRLLKSKASGGDNPADDGPSVAVLDANANLRISQNTFKKTDGDSLVFIAGSGTPNSGAEISGNTIKDGGGQAIYASDDSLDDSELRANKANGNAGFGLTLSLDNTGNEVKDNDLRGNGTYDCFDATTGPLNTWGNNKGHRQNQFGLCKGAAVV